MGWSGSPIGTPEWYAAQSDDVGATYSSSPVLDRPPWLEYMWEEHPQISTFLYYAGFGLFDPKMPAELRLFGPGYVAANILGVGALLWTLDPEDTREGGFLQTDFWERMRPEFPWENPRYVWN